MDPDPRNTSQSPLGTSQAQISFVQLTPAPPLTYANIFGPRIAVTSTFLLGIIHICLVIKTFLAWSGAGNTIDFNGQTLEEGRESGSGMTRPKIFQLPSGSKGTPNMLLPPVPTMHGEIPLAREEEEQGIPMGDIPQRQPSGSPMVDVQGDGC